MQDTVSNWKLPRATPAVGTLAADLAAPDADLATTVTWSARHVTLLVAAVESSDILRFSPYSLVLRFSGSFLPRLHQKQAWKTHKRECPTPQEDSKVIAEHVLQSLESCMEGQGSPIYAATMMRLRGMPALMHRDIEYRSTPWTRNNSQGISSDDARKSRYPS